MRGSASSGDVVWNPDEDEVVRILRNVPNRCFKVSIVLKLHK